uniref:Large ribosomal subunit protein uL1m n=1 Tax=Reclinomonas americana TaxID=48483 RepID=RM01_RECAM|nr:ribosomal protein L1 [Reclinomonas americana]O21235.1 RecName: Full=Large ribosomal subunit protein uL1m; AltName: Full=60S ribosomal protein L1, mitochondrial [Reclinomonas americana]AAD11862.1 ribosomal protein L1 [Reclinomonas americana]
MSLQEFHNVEDAVKLLKCYNLNDKNLDSKIIVGFVFNKTKSISKKRVKIEQGYLTELGKESFSFPNFFGKSPEIALFTTKKLDNFSTIDYVGSDDLIKKIEDNSIKPNYLIVLKDEVGSLAKYSRVLGPKGLMPTPKQGTVVENNNILLSTIETLKKGSFRIKVNKYNMIQMSVGNLTMNTDQILENIKSLLLYIQNRLPVSYRKTSLKKIYVTMTHGPSFIIN